MQINKETNENKLDTLFVLPEAHSKGIGYGAWLAAEALHPETKIWKTCTPYFDKRNIHFYINKCGFQIDEFWCVGICTILELNTNYRQCCSVARSLLV